MFGLYTVYNTFSGFYSNFLFLLAFIAIVAGVLIIVTKNPVISVLHLILLFSSIACYLIFIGLTFIGISYLLVYVGAVSILFLFILMLINIRVSELISDTNNNIPLAILTVLAFFIPLSKVLPDNKTDINTYVSSFSDKKMQQIDISSVTEFFNLNTENTIFYVTSNTWDKNLIEISDIMTVGNIMYTSHSIWLIITSIILLLAMVGSIVITIKQKY